MVLSRIVLNLDVPAARRDLADAYELHSTLMRLVDGGATKPLWRLERWRNSRPAEVLVQTDDEPNWNVLKAVDEAYASEVESKRNRLFENLRSGDRLRFRVRANPTVKREKRRHGLVRFEEQVAWMERQLAKSGATPLEIVPNESRREVHKRRRGGKPITLVGVTFDGVISVEDAERVRELVRTGVGHARALGFGLVTLAR